MIKVHKGGAWTYTQCEAKLDYCLVLSHLVWDCPHDSALP